LYNVEKEKPLKKSVILIITILIIVIAVCIVGIGAISKANKVISIQNSEYEQYLEKQIYGTDVITLINKATNNNENNNVFKDEKGFYITNNQNSIIIELVMITDEEKEETTTYKMETITKVGITEFLKNFNTVQFECTKKDYHKKNGRISYIQISQKYE